MLRINAAMSRKIAPFIWGRRLMIFSLVPACGVYSRAVFIRIITENVQSIHPCIHSLRKTAISQVNQHYQTEIITFNKLNSWSCLWFGYWIFGYWILIECFDLNIRCTLSFSFDCAMHQKTQQVCQNTPSCPSYLELSQSWCLQMW